MVAISLYRGNLHRVPDVPRQWAMPSPAISLRDFRLLLRRRSRALSRLESPAPAPATPGGAAAAEGSKLRQVEEAEDEEGMGDNGCPKASPPSALETAGDGADGGAVARWEATKEKGEEAEKEEGGGGRAGGVGGLNPLSTSTGPEDIRGDENGGNGDNNSVGDVGAGGKMEASSLDNVSDIEEHKRELKKRLDILNEKKHHLVQMLKQILNAEDEIKKRINVQPPPAQASIPLQAEATIDASSVTKLAAPRMLDVNFGSDVGVGGESEEIVCHNTQPSHSQHMYSTSPSSTSAFNRSMHGLPRHNSVNTPRASSTSTGTTSNMLLGSTTASPSRFAPSGHQGHTTNLPPVSISGTHYFASSPSPAASGGASSVFRDSRLTSP